jgi:SAM-dependent methyltransferase/cytidylate kinase
MEAFAGLGGAAADWDSRKTDVAQRLGVSSGIIVSQQEAEKLMDKKEGQFYKSLPQRRIVIATKDMSKVFTSQYGFADGNSANPIIFTEPAGPCFIITIWDPVSKTGFLAHLPYVPSFNFMDVMLEKMKQFSGLRSFDKNLLKVNLIGGWGAENYKDYIEVACRSHGITDISRDPKANEKRSIALDARTGEILDVLELKPGSAVDAQYNQGKKTPAQVFIQDIKAVTKEGEVLSDRDMPTVLKKRYGSPDDGLIAGLDPAKAAAITGSSTQKKFYGRDTRGKARIGDFSISMTTSDPQLLSAVVDRVMVSINQDDRILEVGAGLGHFAKALREAIAQAKLKASVKAIDLVGREAGEGEAVATVEEGNAYVLKEKFPQLKFNIVIFNESIGSLDIDKAFEQASVVLLPGGRIAVTTYNKDKEPVLQDSQETKYLGYSIDEVKEALIRNGFWNIQYEDIPSAQGGALTFFTAQKSSSVLAAAPAANTTVIGKIFPSGGIDVAGKKIIFDREAGCFANAATRRGIYPGSDIYLGPQESVRVIQVAEGILDLEIYTGLGPDRTLSDKYRVVSSSLFSAQFEVPGIGICEIVSGSNPQEKKKILAQWFDQGAGTRDFSDRNFLEEKVSGKNYLMAIKLADSEKILGIYLYEKRGIAILNGVVIGEGLTEAYHLTITETDKAYRGKGLEPIRLGFIIEQSFNDPTLTKEAKGVLTGLPSGEALRSDYYGKRGFEPIDENGTALIADMGSYSSAENSRKILARVKELIKPVSSTITTLSAKEGINVLSADIQELLKTKKKVLVAISGDAGAGKSIFADRLAAELAVAQVAVVRADDFIEERPANTDLGERPSLGKRRNLRYFNYERIADEVARQMSIKRVVIAEGFEIAQLAEVLAKREELSGYLLAEKFFDIHVKLTADLETRAQNFKEREFPDRPDGFIQGVAQVSLENSNREGSPDYIFVNNTSDRLELTAQEQKRIEASRTVYRSEQEQALDFIRATEKALKEIYEKYASAEARNRPGDDVLSLRTIVERLGVLLADGQLSPQDREVVLVTIRDIVRNYGMFEGQDVWVCGGAVGILSTLKEPEDVPLIAKIILDTKAQIGGIPDTAAAKLGVYRASHEAAEALKQVIKDPQRDIYLRRQAVRSLAQVLAQDADTFFIDELLKDGGVLIDYKASYAGGLSRVKNENETIKAEIVQALAEVGDAATAEKLQKLLVENKIPQERILYRSVDLFAVSNGFPGVTLYLPSQVPKEGLANLTEIKDANPLYAMVEETIKAIEEKTSSPAVNLIGQPLKIGEISCRIDIVSDPQQANETAAQWGSQGRMYKSSVWQNDIKTYPNGLLLKMESADEKLLGLAFVTKRLFYISESGDVYEMPDPSERAQGKKFFEKRFYYVEHIEIDENLKKNGLGAVLMASVMQQSLDDQNSEVAPGTVVLNPAQTGSPEEFFMRIGFKPVMSTEKHKFGEGDERYHYLLQTTPASATEQVKKTIDSLGVSSPLFDIQKIFKGTDLWKEFMAMNNGKEPAMITLAGTPQEIITQAQEKFALLGDDDMIALSLKINKGDDKIVHMLVVDTKENILFRDLPRRYRTIKTHGRTFQDFVANGEASLETFLFVFKIIEYSKRKIIDVKYISLGKEGKPSEELRGRGLMKPVFEQVGWKIHKEFGNWDLEMDPITRETQEFFKSLIVPGSRMSDDEDRVERGRIAPLADEGPGELKVNTGGLIITTIISPPLETSSALEEAEAFEVALEAHNDLRLDRGSADVVREEKGLYLRVGPVVILSSMLAVPEAQKEFLKNKAVVIDGQLRYVSYLVPMIAWMNRTNFNNKTVFDYGAGNGVLGLLALRMGAKKVIAVEHNPGFAQKTAQAFERQLGSGDSVIAMDLGEWLSYQPRGNEKAILIEDDLGALIDDKLSSKPSPFWKSFDGQDQIILANMGAFFSIEPEILKDVVRGKAAEAILGGYSSKTAASRESDHLSVVHARKTVEEGLASQKGLLDFWKKKKPDVRPYFYIVGDMSFEALHVKKVMASSSILNSSNLEEFLSGNMT